MDTPRKSPIFSFINTLMVDLPAPNNISHAWSLGSILGGCLLIQVLSGLFLAMRYVPELSSAFDSTMCISREVAYGWLTRGVHANGASAYFLFMYLHMARGLYYGSFRYGHVWMSGVTMYITSMATAFLGYLLPWGQMSYWGATVITNLFSALPYIGSFIVEWMWGGFSVAGPTLSRFYAGHFILPILIWGLALIHLLFLHMSGSSNPLGLSSSSMKVPFHGYFTSKDVLGFLLLFFTLMAVSCFFPHILGDPENFTPANPLVTPEHIKPEWYFLWVYAILRSIPNKLGGVLAMAAALLILYILPFAKGGGAIPRCLLTWCTVTIFLWLTWIGGSPVETPFVLLGSIGSILYFTCMFMYLFT